MILFIGSRALNNALGFPYRTPKDCDFIASFEDSVEFLKSEGCKRIEPVHGGKKLHGIRSVGDGQVLHYEAELAWPESTAESLLNIVWSRSVPALFRDDQRFAPLDALYALKMSHRYRKNSPHFHKTMADITMMRTRGCSGIAEDLQGWFKQRERETYTYSHPKLNTTRKDFFANDGINYIYDHDSIHEAVKIMERPAFDYFKPDTAEVFCSKEMFFLCEPETRLNAVYEESAVLALERSIIPHPGVLTPAAAFAKSLEKVASSITSGWFREFAWENFHEVLALNDARTKAGKNYVECFQRSLMSGIVKPFKSNGGM